MLVEEILENGVDTHLRRLVNN